MRVRLARRALSGLASEIRPSSNIVEPEESATSGMMGTVLAVGGAYALYLVGINPQSASTLGTVATLGGIAYALFGRKE